MRKQKTLRRFVSICLVAGLFTAAAAAQDYVSVLKSDSASLEEKFTALRKISIHGGAKEVPAVAPLLLDEQFSHMARYALEPMQCPEAGAALRAALGKAEGKMKAGLVHSLGMRKDQQAFAAIVPLLKSSDADVAQAAARALARINPEKAVQPLQDTVKQAGLPPRTLWALCDALMLCAESTGNSDICDNLRDAPPNVVAGAFRGAVLYRDKEGLELLAEQLQKGDEVKFNAGLRAAREMPAGDDVDKVLASLLPKLPADRKVRLMQALGERGNSAAGAALLAEATEGETDVRVAALEALTQIGYKPTVDLLVQLALAEDAELAETARDCLAYFPGKAGDAALKKMLGSERAEVRRTAVEMVGAGGLAEPVAPLMKAAKDPDETVRLAAYKGLQDAAGAEEVPGLLAALEAAGSNSERQAVEKALQAVTGRQKRMPGAIVVEKALYGSLDDGPAKDVTGQVAMLVESGTTQLQASNDNFGDTAPGKPKALRVEFVQNGTPFTREVKEGQTLRFSFDLAPVAIVENFLTALEGAQQEAKLAVVRLLGSTGHPEALEKVKSLAETADGELQEAAARAICEWPNEVALPTVMDLAATARSETIQVLALRGAVRLVGQSGLDTRERLEHYAKLLDNAESADEKKTVLGGLAEVASAQAFALALRQAGDPAVKPEAKRAALNIAKHLGKGAKEVSGFGKSLDGWHGNMEYWRFENGAIVGQSKKRLDKNQFLWSDAAAGDFYLDVDIKLEPNTGNGGVQFRSKPVEKGANQAIGYQADVGKDVWGRIYHEHGRGKLDWSDRADKAVKPGEWNRYEILAIGPAVWTFINGQLGAAMLDFDGEREGLLAVQLHGGPPEKAQYRFKKLVLEPEVDIEGYAIENLINELKPPQKS